MLCPLKLWTVKKVKKLIEGENKRTKTTQAGKMNG